MLPVLGLASPGYLEAIETHLENEGIQQAVAHHDTPALFDWIASQLPFQGISDQVALSYDAVHGGIRWQQIDAALQGPIACEKLTSYWHFNDCGYRKGGLCREPDLLEKCPLPKHRLRKGTLNQGAYSFWLFVRDVCKGDFVTWIDQRLGASSLCDVDADRYTKSSDALVLPLCNVYGASDKIWNMILANLLLSGSPSRRVWVEAGASMIAIDSLVHSFLHRTGVLKRFDACHSYGPRCYAAGGCADIIMVFARDFDARTINPNFPEYFPRFVQHAIWAFCSENGWNICNGRHVDDRARCNQATCAVYPICERVPLKAREG